MQDTPTYTILSPAVQIGFFERLKDSDERFLHAALVDAREKILISALDQALLRIAGEDGLRLIAKFSLRGELVFATPEIILVNPFLLAYYRLMLGFSQKEFYGKGPFGTFKTLEETGKITDLQKNRLDELCISLAESTKILLRGIGELSQQDIHALQLLTLGPQFRGTRNNVIGKEATIRVFEILKKIVKKYIVSADASCIKIKNTAGRIVTIRFAADPDIEIEEELTSGTRSLISIEIKGGEDVSNIHNRIGEAEKSHQKAKKRGYFEFMTIVNVAVDHNVLQQESPTTSHFFDLSKLETKSAKELRDFSELISSIISIRI